VIAICKTFLRDALKIVLESLFSRTIFGKARRKIIKEIKIIVIANMISGSKWV